MKTKFKIFLSNNFFSLILVISIITVIFISYNRFIIRHDYIVGYEGVCDPLVNKCFISIDDTTGKEYFFTKMQKYEPNLYAECGADITDCKEASICLLNDKNCLIVYCDEKTKTEDEECTTGFKKLDLQNNNNSVEDKKLQDNTTNSNK